MKSEVRSAQSGRGLSRATVPAFALRPSPFALRDRAGFTLVEVLVALTILGTTVMVLLEAHYGAMQLFTNTRDEVVVQNLLSSALGQAELGVLSGNLNGSGKFGKRYADYAFAYVAQPMGEQEGIPLYSVVVTVTGPDVTRSMMMLVYSVAG